MPLLEHTLGQFELLGRNGDIHALLQPRHVSLRVFQLGQLVSQHLRGLLVTAGRQQAVERELRVFPSLTRLLGVTLKLQIDVCRARRLLPRQVPLRG